MMNHFEFFTFYSSTGDSTEFSHQLWACSRLVDYPGWDDELAIGQKYKCHMDFLQDGQLAAFSDSPASGLHHGWGLGVFITLTE